MDEEDFDKDDTYVFSDESYCGRGRVEPGGPGVARLDNAGGGFCRDAVHEMILEAMNVALDIVRPLMLMC